MNEYIQKIYDIILDYRKDDNLNFDYNHIYRWIDQFDKSVHLPILRELSYILSKCYFSEKRVENYLNNIINSEIICGSNLVTFWNNATLLNIQKYGSSQKDILKIFYKLLHSNGLFPNISNNYSNNIIYLDDFLYHGNRIFRDIEALIPYLQNNTFINIIVIGGYKYGIYNTEKRLQKLILDSNKNINFKIWKFIELQNTQSMIDQADIYYPCEIPNNNIINNILSKDKFQFRPRNKDSYIGSIFNNNEDRKIIEEQFLLAGAKIISLSNNPHPSLRPLGISGYGLGFGSTIVTYRNCPNNAPLALWWGSNDYDKNHPLSQWYPLFPRKTYNSF